MFKICYLTFKAITTFACTLMQHWLNSIVHTYYTLMGLRCIECQAGRHQQGKPCGLDGGVGPCEAVVCLCNSPVHVDFQGSGSVIAFLPLRLVFALVKSSIMSQV